MMNDVKSQLFIIDSNNLNKVQSKMYGYCFVDNVFCDQIGDFNENNPLNGTYIVVNKNDNKITIKQDYDGSFGLYVYRDKDYFAISNSFIYLVDYVKKTHKITFNIDYANSFIATGLCSLAISETMVNEIESLMRGAYIEINTFNNQFDIKYEDFKENSVEIDTKEGIELLDKWYYKWVGLIKELCNNGSKIIADLTGGMDSRMAFTLILGGGGNFSNIMVNCGGDEDLNVAGEIAEHYGFKLNVVPFEQKYFYSTLNDAINSSFYPKLCFQKLMHYSTQIYADKIFHFRGDGGECLRNHWNRTEKNFISIYKKSARKYFDGTCPEIEASVEKILKSGYAKIKERNALFNKVSESEEIVGDIYKESRNRNHFGKAEIERYCKNDIAMTPLIDRDLRMLKLNSENCKDKNLLLAVILSRYEKDLITFRFEGNREIDSETIEYAKKINELYPFNGEPISRNYVQNKYEGNTGNRVIPEKYDFVDIMMKKCDSQEVKKYFNLYYDDDIFESIINKDKALVQSGNRQIMGSYAILGISKIIKDTIINDSVLDDAADFITKNEIVRDKISIQKAENKNQKMTIKDKIMKIFKKNS